VKKYSNRIFSGVPDQPGDNGGQVLILDADAGEPWKDLELRLDLRDHSPTGFAWGYGGSGPAQLALAMLAEVLEDPSVALFYYHDFKDEEIARIPAGPWLIPESYVQGWIEGRKRRRIHDQAVAT